MSSRPRHLPNWRDPDPSALDAFASIRLVAADIDGTLVSSARRNIDVYLSRLAAQLRHSRYGVSLTLATGRTLVGVEELVESLGLAASVPLVLYNGSVVFTRGSGAIISRDTIDPAALLKVVELARDAGFAVLAHFFGGTGQALEEPGLGREQVMGWCSQAPPYAAEFNGLSVDWRTDLEDGLTACAILVDVLDRSAEEQSELSHALSTIPGIEVTRSGAQFIELRPAGVSKATALQKVTEQLDLMPGQVLALGDNDNDVEMLIWAGIGVAVGGATPAAIEACDFVCNRDAIEGAVEAVRLIRNARKYRQIS